MADWTAPLFPEETRQQTLLREAACWMSDIGSQDHPDYRAEQSFLRVLRQPGVALDHHARAYLAFILALRYDAEPDQDFLDTARMLLDMGSLRRAETLGMALRLAFTLSGGHDRASRRQFGGAGAGPVAVAPGTGQRRVRERGDHPAIGAAGPIHRRGGRDGRGGVSLATLWRKLDWLALAWQAPTWQMLTWQMLTWQTGRILAACALSAILSRLCGLNEGYWALITAVIVTQPAFNDTWAAAVNRVTGTVIGAVMGFCVLVAARPGLPVGVLFWIALVPLAVLTAWRQNLRLSCITLVVVVLIPSKGSVFERPLDRVFGILLGTAASIVVAAVVRRRVKT